MSSACNIQHQAMAARHCTSHFQLMITDTDDFPWEGVGPDEFDPAFQSILSAIQEPTLKELFKLTLLGKVLLDSSPPAWVKQTLTRMVSTQALLGHSFKTLEKGDWIRVPILVAGHDTAEVKWFMAGLLWQESGPVYIPKWAQEIMDTGFTDQAKAAEKLVRSAGPDPEDRQFVLFPLALANGCIQFTGGSASLGFGLAFKSLLTRQVVSPDLICTGALDFQGDVLPVGHLDHKINSAFVGRFRCMLCPADSRPDHKNVKDHLIPVKNFSQAWTMASLYSGRQDNLLFVFSRALSDPHAFLQKMDSLPGTWISSEREAVRNLLELIFATPDFLNGFTKKFGQMVDTYQNERANALAELVSDAMTDALQVSSPMAALRWCTANLSLANHLGRVNATLNWENRGRKLVDRVTRLDISLVADFFNHALVGAHNRFDFAPDLPEDLIRVLEFMEQQHQLQQKFGCPTNLTLGKLYGTLVQNYGFCGPDHIQRTEFLSEQAGQALGKSLSMELKPMWKRQYTYLALARLDAGHIDKAVISLKDYLGIGALDMIPERLKEFSCWQISLICRFLAQAPGREKIYRAMIPHLQIYFEVAHPWQLSFFNLGRTALALSQTAQAICLFEKSLEICLSPALGPTIEIMALKPMAFLADLTCLEKKYTDVSQWENRMLKASTHLNKTHFTFMHDRPFADALAYVKKNHDKVFPFSYA